MITKNDLFHFFLDSIHSTFKNPSRLKRDIKNHPELSIVFKTPDQVADSEAIVHWNRWTNGYSYHQGEYSLRMRGDFPCYYQPIPEIKNLVETIKTDNWICDIQQISGLSASKSDLSKFKTLDDFASTISADLISDISDKSLEKNLFWEDGKILDYVMLRRYKWDNNRIHLCNSGGSHHFSAARYIASRLGRKIPIKGQLISYSLVAKSVYSLLNQFDLYAIDYNYEAFIIKQCAYFGAVVGFFEAPPPFRTGKVVAFFPRNNKRSMRISKKLNQFRVFNFGQFLMGSLYRQDASTP